MQGLSAARSSSSFPQEAPGITGKRNPFPCLLAAGLLWQQECAWTWVQGDRNRNLPFCSDLIQCSTLAIARASRLGQAKGHICSQDKLPLTMDKRKPTKQSCPEISQLRSASCPSVSQQSQAGLGRDSHAHAPSALPHPAHASSHPAQCREKMLQRAKDW